MNCAKTDEPIERAIDSYGFKEQSFGLYMYMTNVSSLLPPSIHYSLTELKIHLFYKSFDYRLLVFHDCLHGVEL